MSGKYAISQCGHCGQVMTDARNQKRKTLYEEDDVSVYIEKEVMFRKLFGRIISIIKQYQQNGTLIDVGAGVGLLVSEAQKAGFRAFGFEPSRPSVVVAKKKFHINLIPTQFEQSDLKAQVVVINHVLEHMADPKQLLYEVTGSLVSKGLLVIGVPNFASLMARFKKGTWQNLNPQQHRWHFTINTLDQLIVPAGFSRLNFYMENHDRSMHTLFRRPVYWLLDTIALATNRGEAMLVLYRKDL